MIELCRTAIDPTLKIKQLPSKGQHCRGVDGERKAKSSRKENRTYRTLIELIEHQSNLSNYNRTYRTSSE